jgi:signal transduction histidine kinase
MFITHSGGDSHNRMKREIVVEKTKLDDYQILDRLRSHWLSTLAHDLSNPLFVARGYTRLALEEKDSQLTPSQRKYLTAVLENIDKLVTLAQELNDIPAIHGLEFDTVSFRTLVQQATAEIRSDLAAKSVLLTEYFSEGPMATIGDREKLAVAVRGFLHVAVELTGRGGTIKVQAHEENEKIILRFSATRGPEASLEACQPGVSMPCKLWRLHGGITSVSLVSDNEYLVACELPVIRLFECKKSTGAD